MEIDFNTPYLSAENDGISMADAYAQEESSLPEEQRSALFKAAEGLSNVNNISVPIRKVNQDLIGMVKADQDPTISALAQGLDSDLENGNREGLGSVRELWSSTKNEALKERVKKILLSNDSKDNKRRLIKVAADSYQTQDDVEDYAHRSAAVSSLMADRDAADVKAEAAATYVNNSAVGLMKNAIKRWTDSDISLGVVQSLNPLYTADMRTSSVMKSLGHGNENVRYSTPLSVEDNIRSWESEYKEANSSRQREMVAAAIAAIEKEADGDKWYAMHTMALLFGPITQYAESGDWRQEEAATNDRAFKSSLYTVVDFAAGAWQVGEIAAALKASGVAIKGGVEAVQAIMKAEKVSAGEAIDILKVGYGVRQSAKATSKAAAKDVKNPKGAAAKAADELISKGTKPVHSIEPGTAASVDALVNPQRLKEKMLASFGDEAGEAALYGVDDATSAALGVYPRAAREALTDIPNIGPQLGVSKAYSEVITKTLGAIAQLFKGGNHHLYRPQELINVQKRATEELVEAFKDKTFGVVDVNKMQQVIVDDGFVTQYVVTGKDKGFTAQEAFDAATVYNTEFDDMLRLLRKDPVSGEFKAVPPPKMVWNKNGEYVMVKQPEGEYALGLVRHNVYDSTLADGRNMVLEGNLGSFSTQVDKSSMFAREINDVSTLSEKQRGILEHIFAKSMKDFDSLGKGNIWVKRKAQAKVMKVLNEGSGGDGKPGQLFTSEELLAKGLNEKEMSAYYSVRARFDAEWFLNNKAARADMVADNFTKEISIDGFKHFLKPVKEGELDGVKYVVNSLGEVVEHDKNALIGESYQVFKMRSSLVGANNVKTNLMIIKAGDSFPEGTKLLDLGEAVLSYNKGYVPRMYDAKYVITETRSVIGMKGGAPEMYEKAVATAKNYRHAVAYAKSRGMEESSIRLAREAMQGGRGIMDKAGNKRNFNGVIFGKRGDKLENVEEIGHMDDLPLIDGARNLKTISEVLSSSSNLTSYRQTTEKVINAHIDRWNKAYGPDTEYGWSMATIKSMKESLKPAHNAKFSEAIAMRDHIAMLQGTDETIMNGFLDRFRAGMANSAANGLIRSTVPHKLADRLEEGWRSEVGRDMASRAKLVNFTLMMGLNPVGQLALQASQVSAYTGLRGGFKYAASGAYARDFLTLQAGLRFRKSGNPAMEAAYKAALKASGRTEKEFSATLDAFENSGIMQGLDRHQYLDSVVAHSYAEPTLLNSTGIPYYAGQVTDLMRKIGFNAGESINQTSAWLFARQRMLANNPKLTLEMLDQDPALRKQVVVMATNISGNMDTSSRLKHQDGLLGVILQFTSYATKMSQMMLPKTINVGIPPINKFYNKTMGRFGSDLYTNREKLFISLTQLGYWGTTGGSVYALSGGAKLPGTDFTPGTMGYWLADTWFEDQGLEGGNFPSYARDAIAQGFIGALGNSAFTEMYDEKTSVNWAARFAPVGNLSSAGGRMFEIVNSLLIQDYSTVATFLSGPSVSQIGKAMAAGEAGGNALLRTAIALKRGYELPETNTDKIVFYDKLMQMLPALNNWNAAEAAEKTGYFRSADGSRTVEANGGESVLRRFLGLRPQEELALGGAKNQMYGKFGEMQYGDAQRIQELASAYWREMKTASALHDEGKMSWQQLEERLGWLTSTRVHILNEVELRNLEAAIVEKYTKENLDNRTDTFVTKFAKSLEKYDLRLSASRDILKLMPEFEGKRDLMDRLEDNEAKFENIYGKE